MNLAEQTNKVFEEIADYTSDQFLAEIGGSAGLFLGLSLLTIVEFFASLILLIFDKTMQRNAENLLSVAFLLYQNIPSEIQHFKSWKKRYQKPAQKREDNTLSEKFTSTSGYLDVLLAIDNCYYKILFTKLLE